MAVLRLLAEEHIAEESLERYFGELYRIVSVGERPASLAGASGTIRSTYIVDWEQLVHLLEDYRIFGEDIVEVAPITENEARLMGRPGTQRNVAKA